MIKYIMPKPWLLQAELIELVSKKTNEFENELRAILAENTLLRVEQSDELDLKDLKKQLEANDIWFDDIYNALWDEIEFIDVVKYVKATYNKKNHTINLEWKKP